MAQVNSSPGQNQALGTVPVLPMTYSSGSSDTITKATAVVVPYTQSEPGKQPSSTNPVRK